MLEFLLDILRRFFEFQLKIWKTIEVSEGVSIWDIILVVFVLSSLGFVIVNAFGGLPSRAIATSHDIQESNTRKKYQSNNKNNKKNGGS